jgi:hypothetical protein
VVVKESDGTASDRLVEISAPENEPDVSKPSGELWPLALAVVLSAAVPVMDIVADM